jgi:hypothetical protein
MEKAILSGMLIGLMSALVMSCDNGGGGGIMKHSRPEKMF